MAEMARKSLIGQSIPAKIEAFFEELIQPVLATMPDLIGFSILYQQQLVFAALLAKLLKRHSRAKIVVGGAQLSVMTAPEKLFTTPLIQKTIEAPEIHCKDLFDYLIPGEGEEGLYHLCRAENAAEMASVPGLIFFNNNELTINPSYTVEIKSLPYPDFSQFKLDKYLTPEPVLPLMTSRGCSWAKCSFALQKQYNCSLFYFYDEMIPPKRFNILAEKIIDAGLEIRYGAYAKPVGSFSYELCDLLKRSGCQVLQWGVESASQRVLDLMDKGTKIDAVEKVLKNSTRAGIYNLIFILFGFPSETVKELHKTLSFLDRNREYIHALSSGTFVLTEGSRIHSKPESFFISRIREQRKSSPLYPALDYDVSQGMTSSEVRKYSNEQHKFLNGIPLSARFGTYREHLLHYGARQGKG
jgi:radical SAM superfamily enzyme YgiQ (UPF0313 family)